MSLPRKLAPGDLVAYSLDGYRFLALIKKTMPARGHGHPAVIKVKWCGLRPKIFPADYIPAKHVQKVRD